jgi:hypothetical protein
MAATGQPYLRMRVVAREIAAGWCDCCHVAGGVRFFDYYWVCADCRAVLIQQLEDERLCR